MRYGDCEFSGFDKKGGFDDVIYFLFIFQEVFKSLIFSLTGDGDEFYEEGVVCVSVFIFQGFQNEFSHFRGGLKEGEVIFKYSGFRRKIPVKFCGSRVCREKVFIYEVYFMEWFQVKVCWMYFHFMYQDKLQ